MKQPWTIRDRQFNWGDRTYLMGVLNVTPDSFSDGGEFNTVASALAQAQAMVAAGVDILDIGGESTRPGSEPVSEAVEIARVVPVIQALRQDAAFHAMPISIDTTKANVAAAAIAAGADIVNDISGGTFDAAMRSTVARLQVPVILMHIRGNPKVMQQMTNYVDVVGEVRSFLQRQIQAAIHAGIPRDRICLDIGIGFGKTVAQNLELLRELRQFEDLDCPMLIGVSRKSFIGNLLNQPDAKQRLWGTAAACSAAIAQGADILRVHDVAEMRDVARIADAIYRPTDRATTA
jgi:dihydropteroate synthase